MPLDYTKWVEYLDSDGNQDKRKLWDSLLSANKKDVGEELFDVLYKNKNISFKYTITVKEFTTPGNRKKSWNQRYYTDKRAYFLLQQRIPIIFEKTSIQNATADKIIRIIEFIKECEKAVLDNQHVQSDPRTTLPTKAIIGQTSSGSYPRIQFPGFTYKDPPPPKTQDPSKDNKPQTQKTTPTIIPRQRNSSGGSGGNWMDYYYGNKDDPKDD